MAARPGAPELWARQDAAWRDPASDVASAIGFLAGFGKPVAPIGQAFDGGPEGGREGLPTADELAAFADTAAAHGASGPTRGF